MTDSPENGEVRPPRLLAVGDNVVDIYPELGTMYPGGNAVNVAAHAARVGAESAYIGAVGTDTAGEVVREALCAERVDLTRLRVIDGPNASAEVHLVEGNRVFGRAQTGVSCLQLSPDDLRAAAGYSVVHTGDCSALEDQIAELRSASRLLSFDFADKPWAYVERLAPYVDIATVSAAQTSEDEAVRVGRAVQRLGPRTVAVTRGREGGVLLSEDDVATSPAASGAVVDTLGAGDALIARLLIGLVREESPDACLQAATEYAAQTCASFGAFGHESPIVTPVAHHGGLR